MNIWKSPPVHMTAKNLERPASEVTVSSHSVFIDPSYESKKNDGKLQN